MFSFIYVFISSCFHFFRCFRVFSLLITFVHFTLHCFFTVCQVLHFCVVELQVLQIWKGVFYSQAFFNLHSFLLFARLACGRQFCLEGCRSSHWASKHRLGPSVCLNHTDFVNYMINRELHSNLSKYVDKLPVERVW